MNKNVYLDHNATTPVDPEVMNTMLPYFTEKFGNASSRNHLYGWEAEEAVDKARKTIAGEINAASREIIFTSGATESMNLAIKGLAKSDADSKKNHIVTNLIEHKAVLDVCKELENDGFDITYLPVEKDGSIYPELVEIAITDKTLMVIIMHANNELGTINPLKKIGQICKKKKVYFVVDAAQSFAKIPIDVNELNIDLLAASGHKIYGPKGIGFLYMRRKPEIKLKALIDGGSHEYGFRAGTVAVPLVIGIAKAVEIYGRNRKIENRKLTILKNKLLEGIKDSIPDVIVNNSSENCLAHTLNITIPDVDAETLLLAIGDEVACSTGSACSSSTLEPSHVLKAIGLNPEKASSTLRLSVGRFNTDEEIQFAVEKIVSAAIRLKLVNVRPSIKTVPLKKQVDETFEIIYEKK
jgi:cysteine desulfurase|tara:strand:- start:4005 stop:5237 length:1233 start_codon:yes stop_codon:yes gene_type:complete